MDASTAAQDEQMHECYQKDRLRRTDRVLFGNGSDGLMTKIARMEVRVTWVLRLNWFMSTTVFLAIIGLLVHFATKK